jgi:zinc D-Ala-D-Ala dipeptidase
MLLTLCVPAHGQQSSPQASQIPSEFVYLQDVDPRILRDMRYGGANNFTGKAVPGYEAPECLLLRPVAEALKQVQSDLLAQNLSLKVYDCYRPQRAVQAFARWATDGKESATTKRFYPRLNKSQLLAERYISSASGHSRGIAVDLTLVQLPERPTPRFNPKAAYGPCIGPAKDRAPDDSIDMGTGFDCFDVQSYTSNGDVLPDQQSWRRILVAAMQRHHFKNYEREWWHFTFALPNATAAKSYNFPILPHSSTGKPKGG